MLHKFIPNLNCKPFYLLEVQCSLDPWPITDHTFSSVLCTVFPLLHIISLEVSLVFNFVTYKMISDAVIKYLTIWHLHSAKLKNLFRCPAWRTGIITSLSLPQPAMRVRNTQCRIKAIACELINMSRDFQKSKISIIYNVTSRMNH